MKSARFLLITVLFLLHGEAGVALAQAPARVRTGPPIDSVRVTFGPPEKTIAVTGYVLDKASRRPVPNVSVWRNSHPWRQARTDANGHFVLYLPARTYSKGQLLTVQTLYYEGSTALPADTVHPVELLLKRNAFRFKPYGCQQAADSARISPYATAPIQGLPGSEFAFLIRDTISRQPHKLRTVTFRTGPSGFAPEPFRLHIYSFDNQSAVSPGADLVQENIMIFPPEGTFSYNVSSYNIVVPASGFYLAIEYIVGCDKCYGPKPIPDYIPTGPVLHPPCAQPDIRTWERTSSSDWRLAMITEKRWPLYESALSVEVQPAPSAPASR